MDIGRSLLETDGTGSDHIRTDEHKFIMNGRQVFNFAVTRPRADPAAFITRQPYRK